MRGRGVSRQQKSRRLRKRRIKRERAVLMPNMPAKLPRLAGRPLHHPLADVAKGSDRQVVSVGRRTYIVNTPARILVEGLYCHEDLENLYKEVNGTCVNFGTRENLLAEIGRLAPSMFLARHDPGQNSSLRFVRVLLDERQVGILSRCFVWTFSRAGFSIMGLMAAVIFLRQLGLFSLPSSHFPIGTLLWATPLLFLGAFIHELGHAAAVRNLGIPNGGIGVAITSAFLPAFYTDVSSAWVLPRRQRILVDVAGCYFQLLFSAACLGLAAFLDSARPVLVCSALLNISSIAANLMPVFEFDGYWILVDSINHPHLQEKTMQYWKAWLRGEAGPEMTNAIRLYSAVLCASFAVAATALVALTIGLVRSPSQADWSAFAPVLVFSSSLLTLVPGRYHYRGEEPS